MASGLQDSSTGTGRRSAIGLDLGVSTGGSTANTEHLSAKVGREPPDERAVQMPEAEDAATTHAGAALQQVHAATALIAVGGHLRIAEDPELCHCRCEVRSSCRRRRDAGVTDPIQDHTHGYAEVRWAFAVDG